MYNILTPTKFNKQLKDKGWGLEDFKREYGFADENEVREAIRKSITRDQDKINLNIKKMKQNDKRNKNKNKSSDSNLDQQPQATYTSVTKDSMKTPIPYTNVNMGELLKTADNSIQMYETTEKAKSKITPIVSAKEGVLDNVKVNHIKTNCLKNAETTMNKEDNIMNKEQLETAGENSSTEATEKIAAEPSTEPITANIIVETSEVETVNETECAVVETTDNENELEMLNNNLQLLNSEIDDHERTIKSLNSRKREISKELDEVCQAIKEIEENLANQKQKFERIYAEDKNVIAELEGEKDNLKKLQLEKEECLSKISELMSISLYCDEDNNKSFDYDARNFEFSTAEVTARFTTFFKGDFDGIIDEFPVFVLKKVARILLIAEQIEQKEGRKVELYFDSNSNIAGLLGLMGKRVVISK